MSRGRDRLRAAARARLGATVRAARWRLGGRTAAGQAANDERIKDLATAAMPLVERLGPKPVKPGLLLRGATVARNRGDLTGARDLAAAALEAAPASAGAARLLAGLEDDLQMLAHGFPEEPVAGSPPYEPDPRSVLYLLLNSLPHRSGGFATRTHGLATALRADGWDLAGMTQYGFPYDGWPAKDGRTVAAVDVVDGVPYLRALDADPARRRYPSTPLRPWLEPYVGHVERVARERRVALVHAASFHLNGLVAHVAGRRLGVPTVFEVRGLNEVTQASRTPGYETSERYRLHAALEARACSLADKAVVITEALRREMVGRGVPEDHLVVVPNGVHADRFHALPRDAELAARLGVAGKTVIGYVGTVAFYEGIESLLAAAARLKAERDDFHVLVVGDGDAYERSLAERRRLRVEDVVTFTGRVPHEQVERYYSLIDVAPFPRLPLPVCEMVSPMKPFEAMSAEKAVLVSSVAALAEIVRDGETGLVVPKGDGDALTGGLRRLLDDAALRRRLGSSAAAWVRRERDWSVLAGRLAEVYDDVLERAAR